jgi:PEP-CTERM motif
VIKARKNYFGGLMRAWAATLAAGVVLLAGGSFARAGSATTAVTIDWGTTTSISAIQTIFQNDLAAAGITGVTVTITGANSSGQTVNNGVIAGTTYDADGHVVGTVSTSGAVTPYNLDNYTGGSFLQNNSENTTASAVVITFSAPINIGSISFDYEIFPDINCTSLGSGCGGSGNPSLPSLIVTDTYTTTTTTTTTQHGHTTTKTTTTPSTATIFQRYAVAPGSSLGKIYTTCPQSGQKNCGGIGSTTVATTDTATTYNGTGGPSQSGDVTSHSTSSGASATRHGSSGHYTYTIGGTAETAPQLLGTSGIVALNVPGGANGVTTLTFNDWPATIAFNHLTLYVPEPGSLALLASGLIGMAFLRRKKLFG